jgi:hypothetical protein
MYKGIPKTSETFVAVKQSQFFRIENCVTCSAKQSQIANIMYCVEEFNMALLLYVP